MRLALLRLRTFFVLLVSLACTLGVKAESFADHFTGNTLRVDYIFTGKAGLAEVSLDELVRLPEWAGRQHHLAELPLKGNGSILMKDKETGKTLYATSFSTLFYEWLTTDEAKKLTKSFENSFLLPYPKRPVLLEVTLCNDKQEAMTTYTHEVDPTDILIRREGTKLLTPHKVLQQNGPLDQSIDVVIVAEGYTADEREAFYKHAETACEHLFSHEPFTSERHRFNIIAVAPESKESGVSVPKKNEWRQTALGSNYSTFYMDRYITVSRMKDLHQALAGIPYEHIVILTNTPEYGGGGIYNAYTIASAQHDTFKPVLVHEFGHSFGALADEYFSKEARVTDPEILKIEPWEQNITTLADFGQKWKDMLAENTPNPTPEDQKDSFPVGIYQGAHYVGEGYYRPAQDCRMRSNTHPEFCPVCQRALKRLIDFYTRD